MALIRQGQPEIFSEYRGINCLDFNTALSSLLPIHMSLFLDPTTVIASPTRIAGCDLKMYTQLHAHPLFILLSLSLSFALSRLASLWLKVRGRPKLATRPTRGINSSSSSSSSLLPAVWSWRWDGFGCQSKGQSYRHHRACCLLRSLGMRSLG